MFGIERIHINESGLGSRMEMAIEHESLLNSIYREIFPTLAPGETITSVAKESVMSRYDYLEGIDVILTTQDGVRMTVQEKVLTFYRDTLTVELIKNSGKKGGWYYCTAQYYFVGYNRKYDRGQKNNLIQFDNWILVDFAMLKWEAINDNVPWNDVKQNKQENRRSTFQHVDFDNIPLNCVLARKTVKNYTLFD
jgi:hypothetical protein